MKVETLVLGHDAMPHFRSREEFNFDEIKNIVFARLENLQDKSESWVKDGIPAFGSQIVEAVNNGEHIDVSRTIAQLIVWIIIYEVKFLAINPDIYKKTNVKLTISQNGLVGKTSE
jgi:hypothetical protein